MSAKVKKRTLRSDRESGARGRAARGADNARETMVCLACIQAAHGLPGYMPPRVVLRADLRHKRWVIFSDVCSC